MIWSTADIDSGVIASIAQLYCILLSTLLSINRQQLSLFDANYALIVTSSPLTIHIVFASIRELLGFKTRFFERIKHHPRAIYLFGAPLLPLWFGLELTLPLSGRAFIDSELCSDSNFRDFVAGAIPCSNSMICSFLLYDNVKLWNLVAASCLCGFYPASTIMCTRDHDRRLVYPSLVLIDVCWIINVISSALLASGKGYVLSYGQV